jgi:signal transduction histidine kinase
MRHIMPVLIAKTEEMNLMIEQMIEASRLEEGRLQLRKKVIDLREIANRSVELIRPLADDDHPIRLHCPEKEVPVEVDPDRIGTILTNLLDNAIKYSPDGGEVRLEVARNGRMAKVTVEDHGVGIAEAQLPLLFTRFGRIVTAETSNIRGTGLGLYLARELARMHGGDISVDSRPGRGSTFVMEVPVAG